MVPALSSKISINDLMKDPRIAAQIDDSSLKNYTAESVNALITQILVPIRESLRGLSLDAVPDRKNHLAHMKKYQIKLKNVGREDHTEKVIRAISDRGIIGEVDAAALDRRKEKVEWSSCLYVIQRLGERLGEMIKHNPKLGEAFFIEVDTHHPAYPLALHLLKVIKEASLKDEKKTK